MRLRLALLLLAAAGTADAQTPPRCTPAGFARGSCNTIDEQTPRPAGPLAPGGKLNLSLSGTAHGGSDTQLMAPRYDDGLGGPAAAGGEYSAETAKQARAPTGGVPTIRPDSRPAVVVPLLSF